MLPPKNYDLNTLNDPKNFKGVSPETRTGIIGAIGIDIEWLTPEESGEFTHQELCNGLHYLLATDKDLQAYIERNNFQTSSSAPFILSYSELRELGIDLFITKPMICFFCLGCLGCLVFLGGLGIEHLLALCFTGNIKVLLIACAFLYVSAVILGLCELIYNNICDMLERETSKVIKIAKIITSVIVFIGVMVPICFFMPSFYGLSSAFAIFCGVLALTLFSYVNKKMLCFPHKQLLKPSDELLDALENVIKMLKGSYVREGDNKEACMEFAKAVVRLHINTISKKSSLSGRSGFFSNTTQPANDTDKHIEDTLTYSASK